MKPTYEELLQENRALKKNVSKNDFIERVFQSLENSVMILDTDQNILSVNYATEQITGLSSKEIVGKKCHQIFHDSDTAHSLCPMQKMVSSGKIKTQEMEIQALDKLYLVSCYPVFDDDSNLIRVIHIGTDITKQKAKERDLKRSQKIARIGSYNWNLQKQYVEWSDEMYDIFGLSKEKYDPNSENFLNLVHLDDHHLNSENYIKEIISKPEHIGHYRIIDQKTGEVKYIQLWGETAFDDDGNPKSVFGTFQDVTETKITEIEKQNLEKQLLQMQKMESIGTLAGGIAHDFNNILFPILGHSEMLLEDISDNDPLNDSVREIHSGALRAKKLVQQILTFSRQEKSEMKLLKIQPILKETLKMIRSTVPSTIDILQDIETGCGAVKADSTQIHQIIMNLMTNAYHAMEENGGTMEVLLKQIELKKLDLINPNMEPGHYACLTVKDTGVGMDKELIEKIFDPFFTTKENGKGTGMGLSVVHGIVNGMKGCIQVNSQSREGTAFHVYFPIRKSIFTNEDTHPETKNQGGVEHILLVDDEKAILNMEKKMLERLGYKVTSRTSSVEAREAFRDNPDKFDLIITDMAMPKLPGDKLAVDLAKIRPGTPILLCTGFSEPMSEEKAKFLGINGFLLKPIVLKDLAQKIREVLDGNEN